MTALAGEIIRADDYNQHPRAIGRARRTSPKTLITTESGVLRIDDKPILAGRLYGVRLVVMRPFSSVASDTYRVHFRYTTDGTTPTTSSAELIGSEHVSFHNAVMAGTYTPGTDQTLSVLLSIHRVAGTGTLTSEGEAYTEFVIEDLGVDPGDTGTDV